MIEKNQYREALILVTETLAIADANDTDENSVLEEKLAVYLEELISKDFNKLISILYRIDVSEAKAVAALAENAGTETAGRTIAKLIISRQKEKLYFREFYKKKTLGDSK